MQTDFQVDIKHLKEKIIIEVSKMVDLILSQKPEHYDGEKVSFGNNNIIVYNQYIATSGYTETAINGLIKKENGIVLCSLIEIDTDYVIEYELEPLPLELFYIEEVNVVLQHLKTLLN